MSCRILLVDDHNLVRRGLAALLSTDSRFAVVGEASDGEAALALAADLQPDVIILDLSMPRLNGLETIRRLDKRARRCRVIVLSMYDDEQFVSEAMNGGAKGYILKHAMDEELFHAIETVQRGGTYLSSTIDLTRVQEVALDTPDLTERERDVLQLIVDGHTTNDVAAILSISPHTATRHRANLMQKLNAHSQVELVRAASLKGLIIIPRTAI